MAENARNLLQLTKEQAGLFSDKIRELAASSGWYPTPQAQGGGGQGQGQGGGALTDAHLLFTRVS